MINERARQTYYGAIRVLTRTVHLQEKPGGEGSSTVAYLRWCQSLYPDKKLLGWWDGASYHRGAELQTFLAQTNAGLAEAAWKVTCHVVCPQCPRAESHRGRLAQRQNVAAQTVRRQQNLRCCDTWLLDVPADS